MSQYADGRLYRSLTFNMEATMRGGDLLTRKFKPQGTWARVKGLPKLSSPSAISKAVELVKRIYVSDPDVRRVNCLTHCLEDRDESGFLVTPKAAAPDLLKERDDYKALADELAEALWDLFAMVVVTHVGPEGGKFPETLPVLGMSTTVKSGEIVVNAQSALAKYQEAKGGTE